MSQTFHQRLADAEALDAWEPLDGHAIVTCKIRILSGTYDTWDILNTYRLGPMDEPAIYPGHPVTLALLIVEAYPSLADAERSSERTDYPAALVDHRIPGAGGNVRAALRLLRSVRDGSPLSDEIERARDYWSRCDGQATGDLRLVARWQSGQEQADRVEPVLRDRLAVWPCPTPPPPSAPASPR